MRSNLLSLGMCSAVAAVAVAGSANAGLATGKIDGFTGTFAGWTGQGIGDSTGVLQYANGTLGFNSRDLGTTGVTKTSGSKKLVTTSNVNSVTGGNQVQALVQSAGSGATGMTTNATPDMYANFYWGNFNFDSSGNVTSVNSFDMSNASSFTVSFANNTFGTSGFAGTNLRFSVGVSSNEEQPAEWFVTKSVFGSGGTVTFSTADFDAEYGAGTAANWTNLGAVQLYVYWDVPSGLSAGTNLGNVTLTDFSYNAVPAPGAAALVGMAGLITGRRRKA